MYQVTHMPAIIELGITGETGFRPIEIDMTGWLDNLPNGVPSIVHIRPGETSDDAYIAATTYSDGILTWTPAAGDLGEVEGYGTMEVWLEATANNTLSKRGKSVRVSTFVRVSMAQTSGETPEPQEYWLEQMTELKTQTVEAALDAAASKADAETAEANAEAWATGGTGGTPSETNNAKYYSEQAAASASSASSATGDAIAAKEAAVAAKDTAVQAKDDAVSAKNAAVTAKGDAVSAAGVASGAMDTAVSAKETAVSAKDMADTYRRDAEAWARGTRDHVPVVQGDEAWHDNAAWYKDLAEQALQLKGYMYVYIDQNTGHLIYNATNNVDIDFELDEGRLIALWPTT